MIGRGSRAEQRDWSPYLAGLGRLAVVEGSTLRRLVALRTAHGRPVRCDDDDGVREGTAGLSRPTGFSSRLAVARVRHGAVLSRTSSRRT